MNNTFFLVKNFVGASIRVAKAPVTIIARIICVVVEISAFFVCIFFVYFLCFVLFFLIFYFLQLENLFQTRLMQNIYYFQVILFLELIYMLLKNHI